MSDEFDYLGDRRISKLLDLVLQLATEVHVGRQRTRALEQLLVRSGTLTAGDLDTFRATAEEGAALDLERDAYTRRLVRIITESGPAEHPLREQWEDALATKAG
ncbi:MAG: hypothetical protein J0I34_25080 [Pseudonocardia sp.]|uniref:hypothetical protein n=1 Tax=unclassified Pseudonocardia TaxID=2619320 RepID=UPI00086A1BBB|nr:MULTISPECIES: hypothetical protein [unclassified Pseudonocardia]MBN9112045.1 hypothetical protein [Pseudonocardia sp.]ODU26190.1 MAG: hypothetical protein ABS80_07850 [Pseudonocardia sp. SCN 72-51]ODV06033.1 MAG: hypothetical protein ABT15_14565 [Pseudonocardia sp. SCN 73-27]